MCSLRNSSIFILFYLLQFLDYSLNISPPRLNVATSFINVAPTSNLTLSCSGNREVIWKYPATIQQDRNLKMNINSLYDDKKDILSIIVPHNFIYTGLYSCCYKHICTKDIIDVNGTTSVYVFFNDDNQLCIPQSPFNFTVDMKMNFGTQTFIPCLPTNSYVNVDLWEKEKESFKQEETEFKQITLNDLIIYSPMNGFLIREPTPREFLCKCSLRDKTITTTIFNMEVSKDIVIQKPLMRKFPNDNWCSGDNVQLTCSFIIPLKYMNYNKNVIWIYPNSTDIIKYNTSVIEDNYAVLTNYINISNVRKFHEGYYTCLMKVLYDNVSKEITEQLYIEVYENKLEDVIFTTENNDLIKTIGESVELSVNVNYNTEDIDLQWEKDGVLIQDNSKYKVNIESRPIKLNIKNLQVEDTGNYVIYGKQNNVINNTSISLSVKGKPVIKISSDNEDSEEFYQTDNSYKLKCQASSFPESNITWFWKPCERWITCNDDEKNIEVITGLISSKKQLAVEQKPTEYNGIVATSVLEVTAKDSGKYYCKATNEEGESRESILFIVTDITAGFETKTSNRKPTAGETVMIKCEVSSFLYDNVTWSHIQIPVSYEMIPVTEEQGFTITDNIMNSDIYEKQLTFTAYANRSGLFVCSALNMKSGNYIDKFAAVYIQAPLVQPTTTQKPIAEGSVNTTSTTAIIIIVVMIIVVLLLAISIFIVLWKRKKNKARFNADLFNAGQMNLINPDLPLEEQIELLPYDPRWEFPKDRLRFGRVLGHGAFGRVLKAEAIGLFRNVPFTTVAVKMLKEKDDPEQHKALMAELKIMIHLGRHVNILNLLGAVTKCLHKGELMVIVEYCCHGNLRTYLLKHRNKFINQVDPLNDKINSDIMNTSDYSTNRLQYQDYTKAIGLCVANPTYNYSSTGELISCSSNSGQGEISSNMTSSSIETSAGTAVGSESGYSTSGSVCQGAAYPNSRSDARYSGIITTIDILCYCFQCAQGMSYLESKKLIHRDLAARNVLLAEGNVIKISDFGLAKDIYKYSKYVKKADGPLPIKWMALESIRDRIFTIKSDVWSFGILLWEMFTLGGNPYPGFEMNEQFFKRLKDGYRMEKPDFATKDIYQIMLDCWHADPKERPTFSTLAERTGSMLEDSVRQYYLKLNDPYMKENQNIPNLENYLNMSPKESSYLPMSTCGEENAENSPEYFAMPKMAYANPMYQNLPPAIKEEYQDVAIDDTSRKTANDDIISELEDSMNTNPKEIENNSKNNELTGNNPYSSTKIDIDSSKNTSSESPDSTKITTSKHPEF